VTGTLEKNGVVVERLHFQSRPGLYVTGNLYRPKVVEGKLPTILYVCGHSGRGRDGNKTAFQGHGMWFAANGYVCLIIDTLMLGEIPGIHHGTYNGGRWWWQAAGYTPAGVECWNGIRALDYLVSRPEVDAERLAVTGISGGGAYTLWIAAADPRIRCAVPVSGMSDLESYVSRQVINGHCDCMFMVNTYAWEWTTIAALVAPRPLLFCNSDHDPIFPMDGNERIIDRLRKLYHMYGKTDLVAAYVSSGGHDYRPDLRLAIFRWINKHLKNETGPIQDSDSSPFAGVQLRVFPEDKDLPKDAINGRVDETFVAGAKVDLPAPGAFETWKKHLLQQLRDESFRPFPERFAELDSNLSPPMHLKDQGRFLCFQFETEPDIHIQYSVRDAMAATDNQKVLIVLNPGESISSLPAWADPWVGERTVLIVETRGMGSTAFTIKSPPNYVERAHALLVRTVDQGRVRDLIVAIRRQNADAPMATYWKIVGHGQGGILGAYAALFEPSIAEVVVVDPPASHRQGPVFMNILRVLDIPDALGLLAPRPLTLAGVNDKVFEKTANIYLAAGAGGKLKVTANH
jgi:cephalosporin-C deacetylase-like acetyl esterase